MKIDKHIQIVTSEVNGLSSLSKISRKAIYKVLSKYYSEVSITMVNNLTDLKKLVADQPDLVFLGMKFIPIDPDDLRGPARIWLADYFDEQGIAYTGSGQKAHRLELDKSLAKQRVLDAGLNTSPFYIIKRGQSSAGHEALSFPLFVKPTDRGGGAGVDSKSVVHDVEALQLKSQSLAYDLQSDSLVEQYLSGREFSVAILKDEFSNEFSVMPIELVASPDEAGARMLSKRIKLSNTEVVSAVTDEILKARICTLALEVFQAIGARDYGRVDIRLDEFGVPHFLEANLLPSLVDDYGSFPKACLLNIGLNHEDMIMQITSLGLARSLDNTEDLLDPIDPLNPLVLAPALS